MTTHSGSLVRALALTFASVLLVGTMGATPAEATSSASAAALPPKATWLSQVHRVYTAPRSPWANVSSYLDARVARGGGPLALVLDIDNTSIASHYDWPHAVPDTLAFAERYRAKGVAILFVTGRGQSEVPTIAGVLARAGYHATLICGRPANYTVEAGKQNCRKYLETVKGYTIIANVGNSPTDFTGGNYEPCTVRLPNYDGALG